MRALAALCLVALATPARAEPGAVDWQRRVVRCSGLGAPDAKAAGGNVAVARVGAERALREALLPAVDWAPSRPEE